MNELINKQYADLILNNADFRAFVEKMDKYSTDEIIVKYGLILDTISCLPGLSRKQA